LAGGYAKILAGAHILAIPSSFDRPVTSGASLDLESTTSVKAKLPGGLAHPTATNPLAVATHLSVPPACFPASEFVGGTASAAHQALEVSSGHWHASGCPLRTFPHLLWSRGAGGHAKILVGASTLVIQPSFDSPESSGASTDPESTARAPATSPSVFEHPPAPAPSTTISLPSVPAAHPSVSDLFGGTASVAPKVFEVASSPWFASGCPLGVHTHHPLTREAGGHAKILAGASILAIPSSFNRPVTSGASLDLESTASAKAKSPDSFEPPTATNLSEVATLLSVQPACFPVSHLVGGITPVVHQVLDVPSGHWFASGCPLGAFPHLLWACVAGGHAEISARAPILAIPPSFDRQVSSGASIDPTRTARAPATLTSGFEDPPAPAPSATDSAVQNVFGVVPGRCTASECLVEVHPNNSPPDAAGGPDKILAGASNLAIQPSFDSTAAAWRSPDFDGNTSASTKLPQSVTIAMLTGAHSAARSAALVSEDLPSSALPVCVEPHKSAPCIAAVSRVFNLRMDGVPSAAISSSAGNTLIDWAMKLCQMWSTPQLVTHHLMTGPNESSDPWEDYRLDAIERFYNNDDFESDDSCDSTPPEPVCHPPILVSK